MRSLVVAVMPGTWLYEGWYVFETKVISREDVTEP